MSVFGKINVFKIYPKNIQDLNTILDKGSFLEKRFTNKPFCIFFIKFAFRFRKMIRIVGIDIYLLSFNL